MFYRLFLSDSCLGKACYDSCKYKYDKSSADIRIGDLWGKTYQADEDGVSAAVAFTEKGNELLHECGCRLTEHPFEVVAEGQMKTCPKRSPLHHRLMGCLRNEQYTIEGCYKVYLDYLKRDRMKRRLANPLRTIQNGIKKILGKR